MHHKLQVTGHAGYKLAEVTGGGVPLSEINTATMESKICKGNQRTRERGRERVGREGESERERERWRLANISVVDLLLCGEIVDVFGRIGGFNFYWAWLSGRLAGLSAATK